MRRTLKQITEVQRLSSENWGKYVMHPLLTALACLTLFATPVMAETSTVPNSELRCRTDDGDLYTPTRFICNDGDTSVCEKVDTPENEGWVYERNDGYVQLQTLLAEEGDADAQMYLGWIYD